MMPLSLAQVGEENIIKRIGGSPEVKRHLENLGFVVGGECGKFVISLLSGHLGGANELTLEVAELLGPKS